jgi:large subunit ribosomal protein L4
MAQSLSDKAQNGRVLVVEDLKFDTPKTKTAVALLKGLGVADQTTLVVLEKGQEAVVKSFRNLRGVTVRLRENLNVYDILRHENLLLVRPVLSQMVAGASSGAGKEKS